MNQAEILDISREAILVILKLGGPAMVLALIVGVSISVFQALTQIQEQTLTFMPKIIVIFVAMLVLLPETWAAARAAHANRLQTSLNLALGSALSSIGLTIPAVALTATLAGLPLVLGLEPKELVLLVLTFLVTSITLVSGRTHILLGAVHIVIFAAFLFLAFFP